LIKSSDTEKDSIIGSLQLELGQLREQLITLKESSSSAPTSEQFASLTRERDNLKTELSSAQGTLKKTQNESQTLQNSYTALDKDTKTTRETLLALRTELSKLKESHSSEIQKSRLSHSRASELQIENKTIISRAEELKTKVVSLTSEKLELVERVETLERELHKLQKVRDAAAAGGEGEVRGSVELNTELDALIQGQETRQTIRETNQRRYSRFVGQMVEEDGEPLMDINERRLKKGKENGEFGREKEMGFVIDLVSGAGGCGMCVGEVLVL
jgi:chromosome segregation ATPase